MHQQGHTYICNTVTEQDKMFFCLTHSLTHPLTHSLTRCGGGVLVKRVPEQAQYPLSEVSWGEDIVRMDVDSELFTNLRKQRKREIHKLYRTTHEWIES